MNYWNDKWWNWKLTTMNSSNQDKTKDKFIQMNENIHIKENVILWLGCIWLPGDLFNYNVCSLCLYWIGNILLPHSAQRKDPSYRKAEECYIIPLDKPTHTHSQEWIVTQQPLVGYYPNFKLRLRRPKQSFRILHMKTTSHGRRPQNIISGISQQPLFGSYSNFKLNLRWLNFIVQISQLGSNWLSHCHPAAYI